MKRQGTSTSGQPPVKKADASTDLRSKIGAKLQTLLNGIDTDAILFAKKRKQLYEDLFGKPKYTEIIIDPTIVIKEEPEDECSSDSSTLLNSQNFLLSAKSRLTELLNKQDGANKYKDSGKENTLFSNKNRSSVKSSSLQNPSCSKSPSRPHNSLSKKKNPTNKEHSNPTSDSINNDSHLKGLAVVIEDCIKSDHRTESSPTKRKSSNKSSNVDSNCVQKSPLNKKTHKVANLCSRTRSKSCKNSVSDCLLIEDNTRVSRSKSRSQRSVLSNEPSPTKVTEHAGIFPNTNECMNQIPYYDEDESEMIDDPIIPQVIVDIKVGEPLPGGENFNFEAENSDSEVELVCVKQPTAEVITLEDNDEEIDVEHFHTTSSHEKDGIALIHKCKQCGKSFRAESLLNFHIRMHGNSSFRSPFSLSHSFS